MTLRPLPCLVVLLLLGCAARDAGIAEEARQRLIGLHADDLRLCAGVPNREALSDSGSFWTYDRNPPASGVSVPVPVYGGSVNLSSAAECRVTFQLVEGRVTRIGYSSAAELGVARDAACAPVVQGCLGMLRQRLISVE